MDCTKGPELERLRIAVIAAAERAGYPEWWLAGDLIDGLSDYFHTSFCPDLNRHNRLEELVHLTLRSVGYEEIALQFHSGSFCHSYSLLDFLHGTVKSDRGKFLDLLAERIEHVHAAKARHLHFRDLQACAHELQLTLPPSEASDREFLPSSLVAFIRKRVQALWWSEEIWCSIV